MIERHTKDISKRKESGALEIKPTGSKVELGIVDDVPIVMTDIAVHAFTQFDLYIRPLHATHNGMSMLY